MIDLSLNVYVTSLKAVMGFLKDQRGNERLRVSRRYKKFE